MRLEKELESLDLNPKTAKVYEAILELGHATSIDVAKKTHIKRTTVYDHITDLIEKGYVSETRKGKRRLFIAEDPKNIVSLYTQKLSKIQNLVPLLSEINARTKYKPHIRYYDGIDGLRIIMEDILHMKEKEIIWWSSLVDILDLLGNKYIASWIKRRVKRNIDARVLRTYEGHKIKEPVFNQSDELFKREIRLLPKEFIFDGALFAYDEKVGYISSVDENFGFIIESKEFKRTIKQIFDTVWAITPPAPKKEKLFP